MEGTTGTTGERPATFAQAFASESPVAESPTASTTPTETASASATETPAAEATTPAQGQEPGPLPFKDHKRILDGAYKERDSYKQQLDALAWAQHADRQAIEQAQQIGQLYNQDRAGYIRSLLDDALNDAVLAPVLRSEFGRRLAQRTAAETALEPDIPVFDANGQQVNQTYSADRVKQIVQRAVAEAIGKEVAPIKQTFEQQQARAKAEQHQRQTEARIDSIYERAAAKYPQFKEHDAEIAQAMTHYPDADPAEQVALAWAEVVLPKLEQSHQAKALESLKTKAAAASGSVNPSGAAVASTTRPTSFHDPRLWQ